MTHVPPEELGGAELAGDDVDGEPAGAEDEWDDPEPGDEADARFDVGVDVGRGVDVAVADEVAEGIVAMMGVLVAPVLPPPDPLAVLLPVLTAAQPLGPSSAAIAIVAMSGFFMMATTSLETAGTGRH